ncbi:DNA (cytosine-5-)-methyltransferase [Mycoplasma sp. Ms02]|uniref:DNA (cytosine-5-)-methyltransferase n=1 Tax=Mycoplasma sp. Ms02 TaxID=353851 RepID=UPI001C8AF877|nr:DNA (cytosine-5-)-methyltransferase [Mycoplasma sp. Ms02]QZE12230.1 DNA (cytosine-5-)-methyltransferase [Mycoplasma sp. Ms02]
MVLFSDKIENITMDPKMQLSYQKLWRKIKENNFNKTQFKEFVNISNQTLSKLSKNETVSLETLCKIADFFGCSITDIFEYKIEKMKEKLFESSDLKVASFFAGIGGFEHGIQQSDLIANFILASEIDKFALKSYKANFPDTKLMGDIREIDETEVENHDLLVAGFPCQAFSISGKRMGFEDARGTLFFELARIIKAKKPKIILLENVENLVGHDRSNTILTILQILSDLGYSVDFSVVNSSEMNVPQNRSRTYIVGVSNWFIEEYNKDNRSIKVTKLKKEINERQTIKSFNFFNYLESKDQTLYIKSILSNDVDQKYFLRSDKLHKFIAQQTIENNLRVENKILKVFDLPKEIHNDQERQRRVYSIYGISPTLLARSDTTKILIKDSQGYKIRKLTPKENLKVQGFSDHFIDNLLHSGMSDTQLYKQSGNAVSPPVIKAICNLIKERILDKKEENE